MKVFFWNLQFFFGTCSFFSFYVTSHVLAFVLFFSVLPVCMAYGGVWCGDAIQETQIFTL